MKTLSKLEISRQDRVDDSIFELIQNLNPTKQPIEWDIEMIGDIRDTIEDWIVNKMKFCAEKDFYPYIEGENGSSGNSNGG